MRVAYSNGRDAPQIFALRELGVELADRLLDADNAAPVIDFIKQELSRIQDASGDMRAIVAYGLDLAAGPRVQSVFLFDDISPPQQLDLASRSSLVTTSVGPVSGSSPKVEALYDPAAGRRLDRYSQNASVGPARSPKHGPACISRNQPEAPECTASRDAAPQFVQ